MATKKSVSKKASASRSAPSRKAAKKKSKPLKDPKGGLTAEGRQAFARKEGAHLRPGVQGAADTPEKMRRKGSFLRRHFARPRGPMEKDGKPTRLALSAHAWGEPVPKTLADAKKLAAKGAKLLDRYHRSQESGKSNSPAAKKTRASRKAKTPGSTAAKKSSASRAGKKK